MNKVAPSWNQIQEDCHKLASMVAAKGSFSKIIAITRGGLIPAALLSRSLNIKLIDTVCIESYDETGQIPLHIMKAMEYQGSDWLIIDELVDTGVTARVIRKMFPHCHFATLYAKPLGKPFVDSFIKEFSQDTWVDFPWEMVKLK